MKTITTTKVKYIHTEDAHNTRAASIVVPMVNELLHDCLPPMERRSVVDFGCGLGTWLCVFKRHGVKEILGLDGKWVNTDLLFKYITPQEFRYVDLETPIKLDKTYDLVVNLEVIEHISEESADTFVQSLVNAGRVILFSAAIPGQGGFNHVNEQFPSYWIKKFRRHGYVFHDIIRSQIWNNTDIELYYRQNMFIVAHESISIDMLNSVKWGGGKLNNVKNNVEVDGIYDVVHPTMFMNKVRKIEQGEFGIVSMLKLLYKFCRYQWRKHFCGYNPQVEQKNDEYDYDNLYAEYAE